ncbi:MAG: hypothetical protein IJ088_16195, partial [Clostridia bacterium]|nr:hypothetical protein [Clostridia bacterium]
RTYLGRVDPVSAELIPMAENGKWNRSKVGDSVNETKAESTSSPEGVSLDVIAQLNDVIRQRDAELAALKQQNAQAEKAIIQLREFLDKQILSQDA